MIITQWFPANKHEIYENPECIKNTRSYSKNARCEEITPRFLKTLRSAGNLPSDLLLEACLKLFNLRSILQQDVIRK
jgi:hypothetical protein